MSDNPRTWRTPIVNLTSLALVLLGGCGEQADEIPVDEISQETRHQGARLRRFIGIQVGGIDKLTVPPDDASIPVPPDDPMRPGRYKTTEAKRYLGKLLFHDPVRAARINENSKQPLDLPAGTAFGGTLPSSDPNIPQIVAGQLKDSSCGSCHLGEASSKAGQLLNFASGGEGRGYVDENGNFFPRRRPQQILTKLRTNPLFPGDALTDALPTLTDIYSDAGQRVVTTPARFYHAPPPEALIATGRLDQLDSVGRQAPSVIGFAFNNRLLFGGLGGEPQPTPGSLNPLNDPAGENMTLLLLDAHRMLGFQSAELLKIPAFVKLFRDAFPDEAKEADSKRDMTVLVNDQTEFRAQATFLRTVVTRNTPFDRFLAGDDRALTPRQQRGAQLFFTKAKDGGAGCFTCHSGPMLNKQADDPDVAGIGQLVAENFVNLGIGDHPVQALNAAARGRDTTYHAEDTGRMEVTHDPDDAYKFRALTLRQLKDARTFFHNGFLTSLRDVVAYFNAGIPQDPVAGAAHTLDKRFTHPRGNRAPRGLGLSEQQIDAITDFLENGLYDPSFVRSFQPNDRDLNYSRYRPDLAALGAKDGQLLSGLAIDSNDPLSRRDQGLEFLNVTTSVNTSRVGRDIRGRDVEDLYRLTNTSTSVVDTHLLVIVKGLPRGVNLRNASGTTKDGDPYIRIFLQEGVLNPGQHIAQKLVLSRPPRTPPPSYSLSLLSGQGNP